MKEISKVVIAKIVCLVVLFIATVVGCHAHFNNIFKDWWDVKGVPEACKAVKACPSNAMAMERTFVAFTIIFVILSVISIVASFVIDAGKLRLPDAGYHAVAGLLLFISGILLIAAASQIDDATTPSTSPGQTIRLLREYTKYSNKLAGGSLAIIDALLYFATSGLIFKS
ncbi:uncharacterized protein LOC110854995 [Folsomia candida]|uniref:Frizzled-7 n=1 Tax=Folsomia candida TaxID=158441 RepID=A0A226DV01_FOLCA|nr:uncharacterized protein LOC110854995 [Folsomia candida]OXA48890.1 Frizzled-7 [Folsomia candida]